MDLSRYRSAEEQDRFVIAYGNAVAWCDAWARHHGVPWDIAMDAIQETADDAYRRWTFVPTAQQLLHFAFRNLRGFWKWKSHHTSIEALDERAGDVPEHGDLRESVATLPEDVRLLLEEFANGRPLSEMAQERGVNRRTLVKRVHRARRMAYFTASA